MKKLIITILLKTNLQMEYASELTVKVNDMLKEGFVARLEFLPKDEPEPIGIGVFKP